MTRHAACSCGQLRLRIEGEPSRNAMCHCLACQKRTGAVISNQARYRGDQVTIAGKSTEWTPLGVKMPAAVWIVSAHHGQALFFYFWASNGGPRQ
jgi:glutathione-dependent formaldehyde-activating enzyme